MPDVFQSKNLYLFRGKLDQKYQMSQYVIDFVEFADLHLTLPHSWGKESIMFLLI